MKNQPVAILADIGEVVAVLDGRADRAGDLGWRWQQWSSISTSCR